MAPRIAGVRQEIPRYMHGFLTEPLSMRLQFCMKSPVPHVFRLTINSTETGETAWKQFNEELLDLFSASHWCGAAFSIQALWRGRGERSRLQVLLAAVAARTKPALTRGTEKIDTPKVIASKSTPKSMQYLKNRLHQKRR